MIAIRYISKHIMLFRDALDPEFLDPAASGSQPDPVIVDLAGSVSKPNLKNIPDIQPDPDLDPVHP